MPLHNTAQNKIHRSGKALIPLVIVGQEDGHKVHLQRAGLLQELFLRDEYHCIDGICSEDLRPWQEVREGETNLGTAWPHRVPLVDECC